ncbi:hypothetical protein OG607_40920 [Streptomyces sp. NBC_01537]|uniref:hypothetical protein n=1 Tax=Streptomyces sp. NBC_01537 TaxID=2903896 RepID=UPI003867512F
MNSNNIVALIVALLVPVVTAIAGTVSVLLENRQARNSLTGSRRLAFEDASRQIAFTVEWWQAQQLLPTTAQTLQDAEATARGCMDQAATLASEAGRSHLDADSPGALPSRVLLLYRFHRRAAKWIRLAYYTALAAMAYAGMGLLFSGLTKNYPGTDLVYQVVLMTLIIGLAALTLRFWALSVENARHRPARLAPRSLPATHEHTRNVALQKPRLLSTSKGCSCQFQNNRPRIRHPRQHRRSRPTARRRRNGETAPSSSSLL